MSPIARRSLPAIGAARPDDRRPRWRRGPRSTRARPSPSARYRSTRAAPATSPTAPGASARTSCYVSTDYVFDGTKPEPYVEWDAPNPRSGVRALEARRRARARRRRHGRAHLVGVRAARRQHGEDDPAPGRRARHACLRRRPARPAPPSPTTWPPEWSPAWCVERRPGDLPRHQPGRGELVRVRPGGAWRPPASTPTRVGPIATADLDPPRPAPRPANSVLDNAALRGAGLPLLADFREPLDRLVRELTAS